MDTSKTIFDLITTEENAYKKAIPVVEGYNWSMQEHIKLTVLYKNGQLATGKNDDKPIKNIILPMLRLQYRSEGFDVKDIELFVNQAKNYYKSLLLRKFHQKWARSEEIDTFIDEMVESYVDFGGALVKKVDSPRPEVVPLASLAFADQTDILGGPLGIKHNFAPDQFLDKRAVGWGQFDMSLEDVLRKAQNNKKTSTQTNGQDAITPGKYVEVYEVHGMFPDTWISGSDKDEDLMTYTRQMHIITFVDGENGTEKRGVTLWKGRMNANPFKIVLRDAIYGRALGIGGAEELFESQVWTTYDQIRIKGMLDAASKVILKTTDPSIAQRHPTGLSDMENLEIVELQQGGNLEQLNTTPVNIGIFEANLSRWEEQAQKLSGATDALMGENPSAGTPFKLQDLITSEGQGIHEYRKGKLATFMDELYRDWIIPHLVDTLGKGDEFLAEFDMQELQYIADALSINMSNQQIVDMVIAGEDVNDDVQEMLKSMARDEFMKGGPKKFVQILEKEMEDAPVDVFTNIVGKQKNLSRVVDNLTNIFRQIIAAPQALDDPRMASVFNQILQASGLDPIDTYARPNPPAPVAAPTGAPVEAPVPTG